MPERRAENGDENSYCQDERAAPTKEQSDLDCHREHLLP